MPPVNRNQTGCKTATIDPQTRKHQKEVQQRKVEAEQKVYNDLVASIMPHLKGATAQLAVPLQQIFSNLALSQDLVTKDNTSNAWNGFVSVRAEEFNRHIDKEHAKAMKTWEFSRAANPDFEEPAPVKERKWKSADIATIEGIRDKYLNLTLEEKAQYIKHINDKRGDSKVKARKYGILAAKENTRNCNAIQKMMDGQNHSTGFNYVVWGVKSESTQSSPPWAYTTPDMELACQNIFKKSISEVATAFETYSIAKAITGAADTNPLDDDRVPKVDKESSQAVLKTYISTTLLKMHNDLLPKRAKPATRLIYKNFWADIIVKHCITIEGWLFPKLQNPLSLEMPQLIELLEAVEQKKVKFVKLSDDLYQALCDKKEANKEVGIILPIYNQTSQKTTTKGSKSAATVERNSEDSDKENLDIHPVVATTSKTRLPAPAAPSPIVAPTRLALTPCVSYPGDNSTPVFPSAGTTWEQRYVAPDAMQVDAIAPYSNYSPSNSFSANNAVFPNPNPIVFNTQFTKQEIMELGPLTMDFIGAKSNTFY